MKIAIYARVSKDKCNGCNHLKSEHSKEDEKCRHRECKCPGYQGQDTENQLVELRRYALGQEWEITEYVDYATGKHSHREAFQRMFEDATRRKFRLVLVWALDRFTREGVSETFIHIKKLLDYGVDFESFTEAQFRTTGQAGDLMIGIAAWIAKQERQRISERTKAGLARARLRGKRLGRPSKVFRRDEVVRLRAAKWSWRKISAALKVPVSTVRDVAVGAGIDAKRGVRKRSEPSATPE